jgi:hypothetical protein
LFGGGEGGSAWWHVSGWRAKAWRETAVHTNTHTLTLARAAAPTSRGCCCCWSPAAAADCSAWRSCSLAAVRCRLPLAAAIAVEHRVRGACPRSWPPGGRDACCCCWQAACCCHAACPSGAQHESAGHAPPSLGGGAAPSSCAVKGGAVGAFASWWWWWWWEWRWDETGCRVQPTVCIVTLTPRHAPSTTYRILSPCLSAPKPAWATPAQPPLHNHTAFWAAPQPHKQPSLKHNHHRNRASSTPAQLPPCCCTQR